jgi:hypothetical protein
MARAGVAMGGSGQGNRASFAESRRKRLPLVPAFRPFLEKYSKYLANLG